MNCLIVYHKSKFKHELMSFFQKYNPTLIDYTLFDPKIAEKFDFIVLSGGPVPISKDDEVIKEKKWLKKTNKPVLGICLGFEIVGVAFGNKLSKFEKYKLSASDIELFDQKGQLFYAHKYFFKQLNDQFNILSRNDVFIEAFEHKEKPFLCIQGHPEVSGHFGEKILNYFITSYVEEKTTLAPEITFNASSKVRSSLT